MPGHCLPCTRMGAPGRDCRVRLGLRPRMPLVMGTWRVRGSGSWECPRAKSCCETMPLRVGKRLIRSNGLGFRWISRFAFTAWWKTAMVGFGLGVISVFISLPQRQARFVINWRPSRCGCRVGWGSMCRRVSSHRRRRMCKRAGVRRMGYARGCASVRGLGGSRWKSGRSWIRSHRRVGFPAEFAPWCGMELLSGWPARIRRVRFGHGFCCGTDPASDGLDKLRFHCQLPGWPWIPSTSGWERILGCCPTGPRCWSWKRPG